MKFKLFIVLSLGLGHCDRNVGHEIPVDSQPLNGPRFLHNQMFEDSTLLQSVDDNSDRTLLIPSKSINLYETKNGYNIAFLDKNLQSSRTLNFLIPSRVELEWKPNLGLSSKEEQRYDDPNSPQPSRDNIGFPARSPQLSRDNIGFPARSPQPSQDEYLFRSRSQQKGAESDSRWRSSLISELERELGPLSGKSDSIKPPFRSLSNNEFYTPGAVEDKFSKADSESFLRQQQYFGNGHQTDRAQETLEVLDFLDDLKEVVDISVIQQLKQEMTAYIRLISWLNADDYAGDDRAYYKIIRKSVFTNFILKNLKFLREFLTYVHSGTANNDNLDSMQNPLRDMLNKFSMDQERIESLSSGDLDGSSDSHGLVTKADVLQMKSREVNIRPPLSNSGSNPAVVHLASEPGLWNRLVPENFGKEKPGVKSSVITCPNPDATYLLADERQCDRYHACTKGVPSTHLCDDGFVFSLAISRCVTDSPGECDTRPLRQKPQGTAPCFRRNGVFPSNRSCNEYITCVQNEVSVGRCPGELVFHPERLQCTWADEAQREGCLPEDILKFTCPNHEDSDGSSMLRFGDHERYADPSDCRYFFICLRSGHPRRAGCRKGQVFDGEKGLCRPAKEVAGCENYYKGVDLHEEEEEHGNYRERRAVIGQRVRRWIEPEPEF